MTRLEKLTLTRRDAGDRYREALDEFRDAFIELAALDGAMQNTNVNPAGLLATFGVARFDPATLQHYEFAKLPDLNWMDQVKARRDELIEEFTYRAAIE